MHIISNFSLIIQDKTTHKSIVSKNSKIVNNKFMDLEIWLVSVGINYLSPRPTSFTNFSPQTEIWNHKNHGIGGISCQSVNLLDSSFYFIALNPRTQSYLEMSIIYIIIYIYIHIHFLSHSTLSFFYWTTIWLWKIILGVLKSSINDTWSAV